MSKELLISSTSVETKLAILEEDQVTEIFIERAKNKRILGNIYKGKVTRVLPGMQAAFVDIGLGRDTFLYVSDFSEDYEEFEELFEDEKGEDTGSRQDGSHKTSVDSDLRSPQRPVPEPVAEVGQILPDHLELPLSSISQQAAQSSGVDWPAHNEEQDPHIMPPYLQPLVEHQTQGLSEETLSPQTAPPQTALVEEKVDLSQVESSRNSPKTRRKNSHHRNGQVLIGDLLHKGQEILVQVSKEPIGKKGARITSHSVLPGRYLVFMPTVEHVGVSRRIVRDTERKRLRDMIVKLRGDSGKGFIVRTVGENHAEADFRKDLLYLTRLWEDIRRKAETSSAPALVYAEPSLSQRVVRDHFSEEYRAIRVDDEEEYTRIVDFVNQFNPELVQRVRLYKKKKPLFDAYQVTTEIEKALRQKVWLRNGRYIVINQTEALVAIDVNTGRFVGNTSSLEDTITKTNLDAAKEIVRQIRLRDLGGIIVIDFIDMDEKKNRQKVMSALQAELEKDKSPSRVLEFNEFGLVAITRKRVKQSLERLLCQPCTTCQGTGMTRSVRTVCYSILQQVQKMIPGLEDSQELMIRCHPDVGKALRGGEKRVMREMEEMTGKAVSVQPDPLMHIEHYDVIEI
ncbi:MAG: Rne/Rng family ribonuclease [Acidobacteria bacterium]|nr:Rne/Rng family ribonuclease [Acidobacteriota bacterium]